ncbi:O-antigen ligase [Streptomyces sp. NBC_00083]|uniref:O-antigen ligase family protein n=1 Tax=Streptomyces sp. NBC_00083 TaxID=2975647 RepID=UPI00224E252A|nr:O-antigen ligase family protein [Streptomyces sp. NBC_00083]MCX5381767.1 O-antigen ligase family protein [Streptomyces sp. NBC_00083]
MHAVAAAPPLPLSAPARRAPHLLPLLAVIALLATPPLGGDGSATAADAACAVLVLWALLAVVRSGERPLSRRAAIVMGLPVTGICVAAMGAADPSTAIAGLGRYLQIFVLVPLAVLLLLRDRDDFRLAACAVIGLALFEGGVGVQQYLTSTGASYMGEDIRAVGTFGASDIMGMSTVVSCGLLCAIGLALDPTPGASRGRRRAALGCAALLLVPLAVSFSRGAWIATAVAACTVLVLSGVRRALVVLAALAAATVVLVGASGSGSQMLQERLSSITQVESAPDQSVTDRYTMWAAAELMWRQSPLTGVGLKGFPDHRDANSSLALSSGSDTAGAGAAFKRQPLLSPHNMYLLVLSEQGLIGVVTLVGGWAALLVAGARRLHRARRLGAPLDCALVATGLLTWLLVDFFYGDIGGPSTALTALVLGLAAWWALATRGTATT